MENPLNINASALKRAIEEADPSSSNQHSQVKKAKTGTLKKDEDRQIENDDDEAAASDSNDEFSDDQDQLELQANSQRSFIYNSFVLYLFSSEATL